MLNKTVLLADDFHDSRGFMTFLLELQGCEVLEAVNGLQAVELATSEKPDLILMDFHMPEMDGFEATALIRSQDETKDIPIVIISAHIDGLEWLDKAKNIGVNECLDKPIDPDMLRRVIKEHIFD